MALFQLPLDRMGRPAGRNRHRRLAFQNKPLYRTTIELSTHLLYCAGYADETLTPMADALGEAGFRLARAASDPIEDRPDGIGRLEDRIRAVIGLLDLAREMDAVPSDLDRTTRRYAARCLDLLADFPEPDAFERRAISEE